MYWAWDKKDEIKMSVSGVKCPSAVNSTADGNHREYHEEKRAVTQKPSLNEKQQFAGERHTRHNK